MGKKIILTETASYKDGGSVSYIGTDQNRHWLDNRINSPTKGVLFTGSYGDTSTKAKGTFEIKEKVKVLRRCRTFNQ